MRATPTLTLSVFAMVFSQSRLAEKALDDVAVIGIPRGLKEMYKGLRDDQAGRLTFTFSKDYFWASFNGTTAYKQQLFVSVMAPDASDAEYEARPKHFGFWYDDRKIVRTMAIGSGTLTITEGLYVQNTLKEPSYTFFYVDRARRLQIAWHAVKDEIDLDMGTDVVGRMATSFRMKRDPAEQFAEMRDRPRKEAEERARKRALAMETLQREGYGPLVPGKPVLKNGVYVEWMIDPEPRYQLLVPLGRVRGPANVTPGTRPRPATLRNPDGTYRKFAGTVGWREFVDGEWSHSNSDNAYLPFEGMRAMLGAEQRDTAFVYFYYSAAVRVEEQVHDRWLENLRWFFDSLPEVQRLWREGQLVKGGVPASD